MRHSTISRASALAVPMPATSFQRFSGLGFGVLGFQGFGRFEGLGFEGLRLLDLGFRGPKHSYLYMYT